MPEHTHLTRLSRISVANAVYFITTCTHDRKPFLANPDVARILHEEWAGTQERHGWLIGRYVIMPDHVHFFCAEQPGGAKKPLSVFMKSWKEWSAKALHRRLALCPPIWQAGFFDHVLRDDESYAEKWTYVSENPVRKELVASAQDWPYQGWIDFDRPNDS